MLFGLLAKGLRLSPIVGYLVAGIVMGPNTPGFVGDVKLAGQLAEIGVILLMFGVGLHFRVADLMAVRSIAVPGAIVQSVAATAASVGLAMALGWDFRAGLALGLAVSVASTVVLVRGLTERGLLETHEGHVAVGWLVVEDLMTVLVLVLMPAMAMAGSGGGGGGVWLGLGTALGKMAAMVALFFVVGVRVVPWLFVQVARLRSRELFTLTVLVLAISVAAASYKVFGASMALGAFLAGMVVGQSKASHQAAADALPMRDAFAVLFFVSVGMLFDPRKLWGDPWLTLGVIGVVLGVKPTFALLWVLGSGHSLRTGLTVAAGLAQVGEFSFILADLAGTLGWMPAEGRNALVAGAIVSIGLNPWLFSKMLAWEGWLGRRKPVQRWLAWHTKARGEKATEVVAERPGAPTQVGALVVGHGPAGRAVTCLLQDAGMKPLVVEANLDTVEEIHAAGGRAVFGDATQREILEAAGVREARYLVVTVPKAEIARQVIQAAREANPAIEVLSRAAYLLDRHGLETVGASTVCVDEAEAAVALAQEVMKRVGVPAARMTGVVEGLRAELGRRL